MRVSFRRGGIAVTGMALCAIVLAACGSTTSINNASLPPTLTPAPANSITLDEETKLFRPFITVVDANTRVTFINADTTTHNLKSVPITDPSEAAFVNPIKVANQVISGGTTKSLTFTRPGLYDLYDDTQATIDTTYDRVAPNKDAAGFPYAAEAIIWVKGTVAGLPKASKNTVIAGNDIFGLDFVAVQTGGSIVWHDFDTDIHFVTMGPSFSGLNPAKIGDGVNKVLGTVDAPPKGGDITLTFPTAGLYYYYCPAHADFDTFLNRAKSHGDASLFPIPMDGFVLVG